MTRILLDTSAYSAFRRGHAGVVSVLRRSTEILVSVVVLGELRAGFEAGSRREANRRDLRAFLASPRVSVVPVTETTTERYALIYSTLRANGRPIPTNDMWIASAAMESGADLVTLDTDYNKLPQVLVRLFDP